MGIKLEVSKIITAWFSKKSVSLIIFGEKYLIRYISNERLFATAMNGKGHVIGTKDDKRKILAQIEPDGIIPWTFMEMSRILASFHSKEPYIPEKIKLGSKAKNMGERTERINNSKKKLLIETLTKHKKKRNNKKIEDGKIDIPFTARLMAHYRLKESIDDVPLIVDP